MADMSTPVRLDKYLADMGIGTRSEVKSYIRKGRVEVNGIVVKEPDIKLDTVKSEVYFDKEQITYESTEYYMLNKPAGVVSATVDNHCETVVELIKSSKNKDLFPVGRLDKDTEGLLLITNDGDLAHRLLSPKKHVPKVYYAQIKGLVTKEDVVKFKAGIKLEEDFITLPAQLEILEAGEVSVIKVTIYEGKFHQVKRMFEAVSKEVLYLKRLSMGELELDESLAPGEYRKLTENELNKLKGNE
ncbi:pseudouridine synthase [Anaerocolumna sedimenticola]|uniref:Pseudouridine synthase n=2 Tax=Anaerocolumna sedimenticola TaxID=2696063 RepID=A0A6P1TPJ3_9FIRM|nr:pseudouridine synthase [Anaerocolumna sedimenticola]QHQ62119.1 pseudouridine synthase [Anaerocolumna sedimenticola]